MILVDANVLIYAVNGDTPHHPVANSWLAGALNGNEVVGLDWTVVLAFLRIVTNRRIFPSPLPIDQALVIVDEWVKHPNSVVVSPGQGHLGRLGGLLGESGPQPISSPMRTLRRSRWEWVLPSQPSMPTSIGSQG